MTSTPFPTDAEPDSAPQGASDSPRLASHRSAGSLSPSTIETLVRFDELDSDAIARLSGDPSTSRVLQQLRAADDYLHSQLFRDRFSGSRKELRAVPASVPAESLFAFGRGELDATEAGVVREHLEQVPEEKSWVESLRESPPPATLTWDAIDPQEEIEVSSPILAGPGSNAGIDLLTTSENETPYARVGYTTGEKRRSIPGWVTWTPLAAAALVLAMAIGGNERRSVLDGGLPNSPIFRSAGTEALLFPRGRVIDSTTAVTTYASEPLFEVTPVKGASQYRFELRDVTRQGAFAEGEVLWEGVAPTHQATAPPIHAGSYVWRASATVNGIDRDLGSLSFTVVPATAVDRSLVVRAALSPKEAALSPKEGASEEQATMPRILREDIRRLHASGFLTDARAKARALPPGKDRDEYLAVPGDR
ncbi:hypothetical protein Poly30_45790 [Planctomycetes bacterium Poly30]|uniref:Uncharacterized protein n=1 Tax=Saltatorellus ferox TaxID=2528018 RepID=A0A518EY71_9BACT|nr:hypothetical protein Poly30_45790 [Planctomycetes bacterium Poly30]